jgi:steroid 5-alpha reductase family enzyme
MSHLYIGTILGVLLLYVCVWFLVSILQKRNDVADVAWGIGFVLLTWVTFFLGDATTTSLYSSLLVCVLVTIWGVRLAHHIHMRHRGRTEDKRYALWREQWQYFYTRSFFQVFLLQGVLLLLVAFPALFSVIGLGQIDTIAETVVYLLGVCIWCIGFYFEVVGDRQLKKFLADPMNKGKLCMEGLWSYTRHPNYFGEVCLWWGMWVISTALAFSVEVLSVTVPSYVITVIGPLTITFLILKVSGVSLLERSMKNHPNFASYAFRTNMFFPWRPRK